MPIVVMQNLDSIKRKYDYMPSLGMLTVNAMAIADSVLIPVQAQYLPAKGLEQMLFETAYGAGLLLFETTHLRVHNNDSEQMRIFVHHAKGGKGGR